MTNFASKYSGLIQLSSGQVAENGRFSEISLPRGNYRHYLYCYVVGASISSAAFVLGHVELLRKNDSVRKIPVATIKTVGGTYNTLKDTVQEQWLHPSFAPDSEHSLQIMPIDTNGSPSIITLAPQLVIEDIDTARFQITKILSMDLFSVYLACKSLPR